MLCVKVLGRSNKVCDSKPHIIHKDTFHLCDMVGSIVKILMSGVVQCVIRGNSN
jgi:hypothetical protein